MRIPFGQRHRVLVLDPDGRPLTDPPLQVCQAIRLQAHAQGNSESPAVAEDGGSKNSSSAVVSNGVRWRHVAAEGEETESAMGASGWSSACPRRCPDSKAHGLGSRAPHLAHSYHIIRKLPLLQLPDRGRAVPARVP